MEEARKAVRRTKVTSGKKRLSVAVSCGISSRTDTIQPLPSVLAAADRALYRAKQNGRNQVRLGSAPMPRKK